MTTALVTCAELPAGDEDDAPLPALLDGTFVRWDDEAVDWATFDVVLLRSPWDYAKRRDEFLAWCEHVGDRLVNPAPVIAWNTDKVYLRELRAAGIATVPTVFVEPGGALPILEGGEVVVKPTISAGSKDTARFRADDKRGAHVLVVDIHKSGRTAMVQPYIDSVDARGETALLYFGGVFSHAIEKGPILRTGAKPTTALFAAEEIAAREPTAREREVADAVVAWLAERFAGPLAYARIDLVEGPGGAPLVLEVELTEPSLFLAHADGAAERFAAAVRATGTR